MTFADDITLFTSCHINIPKLVMDTLNKYEKVCGQKINKFKSCYMLKAGTSLNAINRASTISRMHYKEFPKLLFIGGRQLLSDMYYR